MNIFLIAAQTLDGFIARSSNEISTSWTSKEDKEFFLQKTKKAGVVVMGRTTYETIGQPLPGRLNIVYSKNKEFIQFHKDVDPTIVRVTHSDPQKLVRELEKEGYTSLAICGGQSIYTMFMKSGLVNRVYLTIEPVFFGKGIPLLSEQSMIDTTNYKLSKVHRLSKKTVVLEYEIGHGL